MEIKAAIFDLDGVIVDTAKYHFKAWQKLARSLGFEFEVQDNERLKGVSRMQSLEILLEVGNLQMGGDNRKLQFDDSEKVSLATQKNNLYLEYLQTLSPGEILPGAIELLTYFRNKGIKTALATASKNAPFILDKIGLRGQFDAVVDGNDVTKAKPDPQVFLEASKRVSVQPEFCVGFEDSCAGIEAITAARMISIGVGDSSILNNAHYNIENLDVALSNLPFIFE